MPRTITEEEVSNSPLLTWWLTVLVISIADTALNSILKFVLCFISFGALTDTSMLQVRPMFAEHGNVLEVAIIKDKRTGNQQGACCAVIFNFFSCFQFKILQSIFAHRIPCAHVVSMCIVSICFVFRYLGVIVLLVVSLQQAVDGSSNRDRGLKSRYNEAKIVGKRYHVLGSFLTEENLLFLTLGSIHGGWNFYRSESFSLECRGYELLWLVQ